MQRFHTPPRTGSIPVGATNLSIPFRKIKSTRPLGLADQITAGKYIGRTLEHVVKDDPNYVFWCINNNVFAITKKALSALINSQAAKEYLEFTTLKKHSKHSKHSKYSKRNNYNNYMEYDELQEAFGVDYSFAGFFDDVPF